MYSIGNGLTNPFKLRVSVRQGDILSPNLFKRFINYLPDYFLSCSDPVILNSAYLHCLMYADYVVFYCLNLQLVYKKNLQD